MNSWFCVYGDESVIDDTVVYGLVIIPSNLIDFVNECLSTIKTDFKVNTTARIHCRELFHKDQRKKTEWSDLSEQMVYDLLFRITSDLSGKGLVTRVGHVDKKDIIFPFHGPGSNSSMIIERSEQLIPLAYQGAVAQLLYDEKFSNKCKLWVDPNSILVPWFGKRSQIERLFKTNEIDFDSKTIKNFCIPENILSKERPSLLDIADLLAYCSARVLSNREIGKKRMSDRVCESIFNSMNPDVGRFRQIDPMKTKDFIL